MSTTDCVKVAVRVRPFVPNELKRGCVQVIEKTPDLPQLTVSGETHSKIQDYYTFNNVYMPEVGQSEIYETSVKPIIGKLFEGYNVTILAYGQTGSGKTYTMGTTFEGSWDSSSTGIIPRALQDIFTKVGELQMESTVMISCSFLELYQENLYDLLSGKPKDQSICEIREDSSKGIIITGLSEQTVNDATKAASCLMEGGENRTVGATAMNDVSSRSHAIFTVNFKIIEKDGATMKAKFHLVDLAGSERSKKTKATGTRFKEGVKINQGLLALGNVISALGGGSGSTGGFISYRDSKLTRLLQDSLGGNSVTLMIACVSPADYNIEETLSTLRYADRAKKIKNKPVKNQDSNEVEIKRLKDIIHELRMAKIMENRDDETSTMAACGEACKKLRLEALVEIRSLHYKLSTLVTDINGMHNTHLIEESFYNELIERFELLRDLLLMTCRAEFAVADTKIFDKINDQTTVIDELIKSFRNNVRDCKMSDDKIEDETFEDEASNQKRLEYNTAQMQALKQIQTLEREMEIKQDLLNRKNLTTPFFNEEAERTMIEYQETIKNLEKELDEARSGPNMSAARRDHNTTKVNMDRKHKVEKLEKDLQEIRKKCLNLEKNKKLAEQDRKRIEDLKKEIQEMKSARVQLIRLQRTDSERFKKWINSRDKEINTLKEKGKKVQNEMKRMERMHERQQVVLKRKVEEAKAVNKRLQDAMQVSKIAQAARHTTSKNLHKNEVIQTYLEQELSLMLSTVDAKIAMQQLMGDRGLLTERMMNLKSTVNKNASIENEIKQLEEDLEMRNTQIADIREKIMQTDIDAKLKQIENNFNSVAELKLSLNFAFRACLEVREDFIDIKTKAEDLKISYEANEDRIEQLNEEIVKEREEHSRLKSQMEADFDTKLAFLLPSNQLGDDQPMENVNAPHYVSMATQLLSARSQNKVLMAEIADLKAELNKAQGVKSKTERPKKSEISNETFTKRSDGSPDMFDSDDEDEFNFNDSFHDPDWVKTPNNKRTMKRTTSLMKESVTNRMDGTGLLANISETSEGSSKRSSNGQIKCRCKGSCATNQCGCKKVGNYCTDTCKCTDACVNQVDDSKDSDEAAGGSDSPTQQENTLNDGSPSRKQPRTDFNKITTPYYPYTSKKRKPLLQI